MKIGFAEILVILYFFAGRQGQDGLKKQNHHSYYTGRPPAFAGGLPVIAETINGIIFQADRLMKLSFLQLPDTGEGYCR